MNITKERVKNAAEVDDEYVCPICLYVLWKPVECEHCQRIFCKQCIDKCLKEKPNVCPLCQTFKEKRCSPMFYSLLCKFKIECENNTNGCQNIVLYESLEQHQEDCQYQMKKCRGCQQKVLKRDLHQHELSCGEVTVECKQCKCIYKQTEKHERLDCLTRMFERANERIELLERANERFELLERANERIELLERENSRVQSLEKQVENLKQQVQILEDRLEISSLSLSIIHDLPTSRLPSWKIIYNFPYSHVTTVEELRGLKPQCKDHIIVGAINESTSTTLALAAIGPADILSLDSPLNKPTQYGSVNWYLTPQKSFGFAPSSTTINCTPADNREKDCSESRLSWHLSGGGGWRAGVAKDLNGNNSWRKIIMTKR